MPFFYYFKLTQSLTVLNMVNSEFGVFNAIQIPGDFFGPEEMFLSTCCPSFFADHGSAAACFQAVAVASVLSVPSAEASVAGVVCGSPGPHIPLPPSSVLAQ